MTAWLYCGFLLLVTFLLALDLGVLNRKDHVIGTREALAWTTFWICLALLFNVGVYFLYENNVMGVATTLGTTSTGKEAALDFFTGYLIEKSLSLDNIFVIALIFNFFRVPLKFQHRVLFWGILGALLMRGAMIGAGTALVMRFSWAIYVFGGFLVITALRMLFGGEEPPDLDDNWVLKAARRIIPVTDQIQGNSFFTTLDGKRAATPLFLVLLLVESSDVIFAVDSIPAIFGVTLDPFIVFTSNIFAILGLRSLYFVLAGLLDKFHYLKYSLVFILLYVGIKMLVTHHLHIPTWVSLIFILTCLIGGTIASAVRASRMAAEVEEDDEEGEEL